MNINIYLDESGDLGWTLDKPYRHGGSSKYLTIAALVVPSELTHIPKRFIKKLYKRNKWNPKIEKKWSAMTNEERKDFAYRAKKLVLDHAEIRFISITVKKKNVLPHIRSDANKLYNYMIKMAYLNEMSRAEIVHFIPDPRSIKVESGNSLHDYLQTELWFQKQVKTRLITNPIPSDQCSNLQFADMLSGIVQGNFEDNSCDIFNIISDVFSYKTLFF
ncbi:hypothetical protein A3K93_00650 [Acinetobacter sp. NCu2D-2]|uniref:DUF3800 domain-containing protein n=1 Tax=Acinetobacter sp. NCu2D-2 TaxID=1608473 RepID=UPI0007CDBBA9|nr:DUF3800 domain-containing protein [Acinetobacter sp. NCu2D-2]ANF80841.1 hypothetical protein A3K93_00650 [Acinetobacter sp. NCu2D-2]